MNSPDKEAFIDSIHNSAIDKKVSVAFKNAIQIEKRIADANREIWYIDGMSRETEKPPKWTIGITQISKLISLGTVETH